MKWHILKGIIVFLLNIICFPITVIITLISMFELLGGGKFETIWKWLEIINLTKENKQYEQRR